MAAFAKFIAQAVARRLARRSNTVSYILLALPLVPVFVIAFIVLFVLMIVTVEAGGLNSNDCGSNAPAVSSATGNLKTGAQFVHYFESQGISPNASAGIVGNLQQETGLNPLDTDGAGGGGLAEWNASWYATMAAYARSKGLSPTSAAGQLTYIVYDLRTSYAQLLSLMNNAPDPATAAEMFETGYEKCSGVVGFMQVIPGSLCDDDKRKAYAVSFLQAAGGSNVGVPINADPAGVCVSVGASAGGDPIPGFTPSRDDMGVDACAKTGMPIFAPADSKLVEVITGWFDQQPLLLFKFTQPMSGTPDGDQYWYVAEEVSPVNSLAIGTTISAGQPVATFAPTGTCIEIGWGSPTSSARTLADQEGDGAAANPPAGALTKWGETFKTYFHIPWVGQSP